MLCVQHNSPSAMTWCSRRRRRRGKGRPKPTPHNPLEKSWGASESLADSPSFPATRPGLCPKRPRGGARSRGVRLRGSEPSAGATMPQPRRSWLVLAGWWKIVQAFLPSSHHSTVEADAETLVGIPAGGHTMAIHPTWLCVKCFSRTTTGEVLFSAGTKNKKKYRYTTQCIITSISMLVRQKEFSAIYDRDSLILLTIDRMISKEDICWSICQIDCYKSILFRFRHTVTDVW